MNRVSLEVRRIYAVEESKRKVAFSIKFDDDIVKEEFKNFLLDNNLVDDSSKLWLDTYFSKGFFLVEASQVVTFFNYLSKLFTKYSFIISETGGIPIQLTYVKEIVFNMVDSKLYNTLSDMDNGSPISLEDSAKENEVIEYVNGLIAIFKLFV